MWRYDNITFIWSNEVACVFGTQGKVDSLTIYVKSKYALMQALNSHVLSSIHFGIYTDIDRRTVRYDKPYKV